MSGWLAGLDALVVGTAYLVALLAARFVARPLLVSILGQAPVIGGWLSRSIDSALGDFERAISPAAEASLGAWVSALSWLVTQGWSFANAAGDLGDGLYAWAYNLVTVTLPHAGGLATQYLEGLITSARGDALGLFQSAEHDAQQLTALAEQDAQRLVASARADATSEVSAAESVVLAEIRKAEQASGELWLQAEHDAQLAASGVESRVVALVEQARAAAALGIQAAEHDIQALAKATGVLIEDSTAVIREDLGNTQSQTKQALDAAEQRMQEEIDSVIKSGPWQALVAAYEGGEAALKADVEVLVAEGLKQIRAEITNAEALRAKYAPLLQAQITQRRQARARPPVHS